MVAGSAETCARLGEFERCGSGCWGSAKMNRRLGLGCHGDSARRKPGVAHTGKGRGDGLRGVLLAASEGHTWVDGSAIGRRGGEVLPGLVFGMERAAVFVGMEKIMEGFWFWLDCD